MPAQPVEHNHALETVLFAQERARLAIESADLGVYEINLVDNSMEADNRFNTVFGFEGSVTRRQYIGVIHPEDVFIRNNAHLESLVTGRLSYEVRVIWPDKSLHWIKITGKVFYNQTRSPVKILGVVQDITELRELSDELSRQVENKTKDLIISNHELLKLNEELQQYAHVSSHDLQEPLRKIRIYAEMIMTRDLNNLSEASQNHFLKITAAAERLTTSLKDLLNFNSFNKDDPHISVDLNEVVRLAENDLELIIHQKAAVITYPVLPVLRAIPVQMHQLFYNLLNNALKFSGKENPSEIKISVYQLLSQNVHQFHHLNVNKKYVEIIITDNGIGFDQQNADKIFGMFQRLHDRREYSGTGIGLALCKKVVQNHGGKLWASSAPGKGASFHIVLPLD